MEQVISDFTNIAAGIVGAVMKSIPEPDTQAYFLMLGTLLALLALLCVWLLIRLRRARLARAASVDFAPDVTFEDISAATAASQPRAAADLSPETAATDGLAESAPAAQGSADGEPGRPTGEGGEAPAGGFRFFKRKAKGASGAPDASLADDDVFLLGLEQEMLATRQLYLDGLITKEVYVTETRALYDKAQSRMS